MLTNIQLKKLIQKITRQRVRVTAFFFLGFAFGVLLVSQLIPEISTQGYTTEIGPIEITRQDSSIASEKTLPTYIRIPSVGIEALFEEPLGVQPNKEIEIPDSYETVGYYKYGPTPGEIGPSVVLGHLDSFEGPAIFWSLGKLEPGDKVEIDREDGTTAVFEVTKLDRPKQSEFPTAEVYGDIDFAGLRLITCSGKYDKGVLRYSNNLIVYAKLIEIR